LQATDSEQDLLQRCLDGDQQAQYQLYNRYVTAMYNTAIRIVSHSAVAEDVLQESFTKVFRQLHTFRKEASIGAWIKQIVVNTALNHLRSAKKMTFVPLDTHFDAADEPGDLPDSIDASIIHEAIKKLPGGSRVVFTLFAVENMSHKAIAEELGITESTSKTQYFRAKQLLRDQLKSRVWIH
jgi:RNA polymerase sigma factor (sigma-70 family)